MEVYHGTILSSALDIKTNGIDLSKSKKYLDFGKGFYVTPDYKMAENMARRVAMRYLRNAGIQMPAVITFEYSENSDLSIKKFEDEDIEWAKFVLRNRVTKEIHAIVCVYHIFLYWSSIGRYYQKGWDRDTACDFGDIVHHILYYRQYRL